MRKSDDRSGNVEVGVIVHNGEIVLGRNDGCEQVGHSDCAMTPSPGQRALRGERPLPMLVIGREVFVSDHAIGSDLPIFGH
jgi:hypothetical protein